MNLKKQMYLAAGLFTTVVIASARADLILHYTFDNAAAPTADTGTTPAANGNLYGGATIVTTTPSGTGGALSTGTGNNAYLSTGTGDTGDTQKLDSLSQITITGWLNLQADPLASTTVDRLVSKWDKVGKGFELLVCAPLTGTSSASNFRLQFVVDNQVAQSTIATSADHTWLFYAVTYNSVTGTVTFYTGTDAASVTQFGSSITLSGVGVPDDTTLPLEVGGSPTTDADRSPSAYFDDIRIYNTVLTKSDLETVRASNVPEPATATLVGGGILTCLCLLRKK